MAVHPPQLTTAVSDNIKGNVPGLDDKPQHTMKIPFVKRQLVP